MFFIAILVFNERIIMGTIDIFSTFAKQLGLSKEIVSNKVILMRANLFIIRNVTQTFF